MLRLLSEADAAVALSGVSALSALLGDFNFEEGPFAPHMGPAIQLLMRLASGSAELDTQKQVCVY